MLADPMVLSDRHDTYPFRKDSFFLLGDEVRDTTVSCISQ